MLGFNLIYVANKLDELFKSCNLVLFGSIIVNTLFYWSSFLNIEIYPFK